jgi:iron complex transport system ATP-binding protein
MQIVINDIAFSYNCTNVLENVSLTVKNNQFISILGPNGSGKSTLLKCMNRILKVKQGSVMLDEKSIDAFNLRNLAKVVSYVPQHTNNKNTSSVYEILEIGRCPYINWRLQNSDREAIDKVIEDFHLQPFVRKQFSQLSGGEQQKVKIARALVQEPQILLLDEPTNNLDLKHQVEVLLLLSDTVKNRDISAIMAIHDLNLAARYTNTVILLKTGKVFDVGNPIDVINKLNVKEVYGVDVEILKYKNSILVGL